MRHFQQDCTNVLLRQIQEVTDLDAPFVPDAFVVDVSSDSLVLASGERHSYTHFRLREGSYAGHAMQQSRGILYACQGDGRSSTLLLGVVRFVS